MRAVILLTALILPSIALAQSANQRQQNVNQFNAAEKTYVDCASARFNAEREQQIVKDHVIIGGTNDPRYYEKLASKQPIPRELIARYINWQTDINRCRASFVETLSKLDFRLVQLFLNHFNRLDNGLLSLMKGEVSTIGEMNEAAIKRGQIFRQEYVSIMNQLNTELRELANQEQQQKNARQLNQALQTWIETQTRLQESSRILNSRFNLITPTITNCSVYRGMLGDQISCTSQ
jgi:hypothetical protein